jgi:membrane protein
VLTYFDSSPGWRELLTRTDRETQADDGFGLAAQLAYHFFLSLFPALIVLLALASFLPARDLVGRVVSLLEGVATEDVLVIVRQQLGKVAESRQGGLLSFGVAAALWSSSAAIVAIIDALNRAYDVEDRHPWWKQRATAILPTLGVARSSSSRLFFSWPDHKPPGSSPTGWVVASDSSGRGRSCSGPWPSRPWPRQ